MTSYIIRRLGYAVITFIGITIATFVLVHSVPGDPISFFIGRSGMANIPAETLDAIRHEHGLDQPLPVQYVRWFRAALTLDFGRSIVDRRPVRERILEKLPNTFQINFAAFLIAAGIGLPIGLWSAARAGRPAERASAVAFFLLYSLPSFWVALVLMQLFSVRLGWLPLFGMNSDDAQSLSTGGWIGDRLMHGVLPVITLAYAQVAVFARFSKSALTEVIRQDFITAARARGAGEPVVLFRHAFRNALIPLITLLAVTVPYLISGSVIVEQIFQWDGIGLLYFEAVMSRDYPTVMALTVATAVATLLVSLAADLLYAWADPRIRLAAGEVA